MSTKTALLEGVPGTDATSSKRGIYYQDAVSALAWTKLEYGEELQLELAEDAAKAAGVEAQITQIKDVAAPLTLVSGGIKFLERALLIMERNPGRQLSFIYWTTAPAGDEHDLEHRPAGKSGILYWQEVQKGADPRPLIEALERLAPSGGKLEALLDSEDEAGIVDGLVRKVTWAIKAPVTAAIKAELKERIARIALEECNVEMVDGRRLLPTVLDEITQVSTRKNEAERRITYDRLRELLREASSVTLPKKKYAKLVREAEFAKNPPVAQINVDIEKRLELLRQTRFFSEANLEGRALTLANDVKDGGSCQLGDPGLRALALSWCARALVEAHPELCDDLLDNAERLGGSPDVKLVRALLLSKTDKNQALRLIADERTPASETVRYAIARRDTPRATLEWLTKAHVSPSDLDPGGQFLVLWALLSEELWSEAVAWWERIPDAASASFPALQWAGAHTLVAWAAAEGARNAALAGPPIGDEIPLRDDLPAVNARRRAVDLFKRFQPAAEAWGLSGTAELALEFSLWLMLEDRSTHATAIADVSRVWKDSEHSSRWIPLALRAGLDLDIDDLAASIDRKAERYGSLSMDDARARLSLILASPAEKWVDAWPIIRTHISDYFVPGFLEHIHIQGLIQLDRTEEAREAVRQAIHLPAVERQRFQIELGDADEETLSEYRATVDRIGSPGSLHNLLKALVKAGDVADASGIAFRLYEQTGEHGDAEAYLRLLARQSRWQAILEFIDSHRFLLDQSTVLARMYVDALIRFGRWEQAREVAESLTELEEDREELELLLTISAGHWEAVGRVLENAFAKANVSGEKLLRFGRIATNLGNFSLARRLVRRAVEMSGDEPSALWNAYLIAVQGHWEDDPAVRHWLAASIASANTERSPVQSRSLSDLVELAPKWRSRTEALASSVASGDMFLALAAQQLNRPLAGLIVGTAESNERESDFRRVSPISAFAGTGNAAAEVAPRSIALDATAMLNMAKLNILPKLLTAFDSIHVPHGIGPWLFSETGRVRFHQPGKIAEARRLLQAVARKELRVADADLGFSRALAGEVGVDLAQFLQAAELDKSSGKDAFVIRPTPLHRAGSLLEETAELGSSQELMRSTLEAVRSLRHYGLVQDHAFDDAMEYLAHVDQGWPEDGRIPKGATLYLDDLAVAYFQHVGLIRALADAKFDLVVHPDVHAEAVSLSALEETNEAVGEVLDSIRQFFVEGQKRGVVHVLPQPSRDLIKEMAEGEAAEQAEMTATLLLAQMFERAVEPEVVIFDDRAANRNQVFTYPDGQDLPLRTTLDVLDWMLGAGQLDERDWLRCRTSLRRSGYLFVPVASRELVLAIDASSIHDGELYESVAARAIRENYLLAQASAMLRMPDEAPWLVGFSRQVVDAVTTVWASDDSDDIATVKATWLLELSRWDGFADRMLGDLDDARWVNLDAIAILRFLMNLNIPEERRSAYNTWIDKEFLEDMIQARPIVFQALCEMVKKNLSDVPRAIAEGGSDPEDIDISIATAKISKEFINHLPASIRDVVFDDDDLFEALGLRRSAVITARVKGSPEFDAEALYRVAALVHEDRSERSVTDKSGTRWSLSVGVGGPVSCTDPSDGRTFQIAHSPLVSPVANDRIEYAETFAKATGVDASHVRAWFDELARAPLASGRIERIERDFQNCPRWHASNIEKLLANGKVNVANLVPMSRVYYERLLVPWSGQSTVYEFSEHLSKQEIDRPTLSDRLVWSSQQSMAPTAAVCELSSKELRALVSENQALDMWSKLGLLEAVLARPDAMTEMQDLAWDLLKDFSRLLDDDDRLQLVSSLVGLVDAAVNTSGILSDVPVYWRRLATIAHAALIERAVNGASVDVRGFAEWADGSWPLYQAVTLADLPSEPRWNGFMLYPTQLKQEFLGRLTHAFEGRRSEITEVGLRELVFGENESSLQSRRNVFFSSLPGPIEAADAVAKPLPDELVTLLISSLDDDTQPLLARVQAAAHLAGMGSLPDATKERVTQAVVELDKSDVAAEAGNNLPLFLMRLSLAAAATRDGRLAAAVKHLALDQPRIPMAMRVYAGVSACAAEWDQEAWRSSVGNVLARCTTSCSDKGEAEYVLFVLRALCDANPNLKRHVAQTFARLQGVIKGLH